MPSPTNSGQASFVPLSGDNSIDSLLTTTKWGGAFGTPESVTYSFPGAGSLWSTDFTIGYELSSGSGEPSNVGDIRVAWTTAATVPNEQAHAYTPGNVPKAGDIWLNANASGPTWGNFVEGS